MSTIKQFFSNPLVGILGSLASLIGLAVSFYFYYASIKTPFFCYHVKPDRATIVKSSEVNGFEINYSGKQIRGDISAVQIAIWNAGKQPIKAEHILNKIQLITGGVPMIEARIQKSTRDVCGIILDKSELEKGVLGVSWRILEEGDGGVIQIIYNGSAEKEIKCIGDIEGQKKFGNYSDSSKSISSVNYKRPSLFGVLMLPLSGICLLFCFVSLHLMARNSNNSQKTEPKLMTIFNWAVYVILLVVITSQSIEMFNKLSMSPPFDY